jgi:hypothetical protein
VRSHDRYGLRFWLATVTPCLGVVGGRQDNEWDVVCFRGWRGRPQSAP